MLQILFNLFGNIGGVAFFLMSIWWLYKYNRTRDYLKQDFEDDFPESECDECPLHSPDGCLDKATNKCPSSKNTFSNYSPSNTTES